MESNFAFLHRHDPRLAQLGARAEANFTDDPNTCIVKLRQFAETLVKHVATTTKAPRAVDESISDWTRRLVARGTMNDTARSTILEVWRHGSDAVHDIYGDHALAAKLLRDCRSLAVWLEATLGNPSFRPPKFTLPPRPEDADRALAEALAEQERLTQQLESNAAALAAYQAEAQARLRALEKPTVVLQRSLADALALLPTALRTVVKSQVMAFKQNPELFELTGFGNVADDKLRWVVLDGGHDVVLVVARAPQGDLLVCCWVGRFEEATEWARRRHVEVHPELGMLQVFDAPEVSPAPPATGFLSQFSDADLGLCGIPRLLLPSVRAVGSDAELQQLTRHLPDEAATALGALAAGASLDDARAAAGLSLPRNEVDPTDFQAALGHAATRRAFVRGDDDAAFLAVLDAPLEQWRVFLHPVQQQVVRIRAKGPVQVLGGAGTGKTVALLHRVAYLLRERLEPHERVLVTTFTQNLARDLQVQLTKLLSSEELARVEVTHLHHLAARIVRDGEGPFRVVSEDARKKLWDRAKSLADPKGAFEPGLVQDEWRHVVQAQGVRTRQDYWKVSRAGRGTPLSRAQKNELWSIFQTYRELLDGQLEWPDVVQHALDLAPAGHQSRFAAVLVDEVQDLNPIELRLLRALAIPGPDDLFLVGDAHQRIYGLGCSLTACGIQVRGRSYRLKVNYRTTEAIRRLAVGTLSTGAFDDLDGGQDTLDGYRSLRDGEVPVVRVFPTAVAEQEAVVALVRAWLAEVRPEDICVAARTEWLLKGCADALVAAGITTCQVQSDASADMSPGVRLATMHRMKGTEFKRVVLCSVHDGAMPLRTATAGHGDDAAREDAVQQERCLLYVAATRARDLLAITGHGRASPFLQATRG